MRTAEVNCWFVSNGPVVGVRATATKAAGGAGVRHVACSMVCSLGILAALAVPAVIVVRDGASDVGPIIFQVRILNGVVTVNDVAIVGSANTAMTVEFTGATGVLNYQDVWMQGYDVVG